MMNTECFTPGTGCQSAPRIQEESTGVPRSLETDPPKYPAVGLFLGPFDVPRGGGGSDERASPVVRSTHAPGESGQ